MSNHSWSDRLELKLRLPNPRFHALVEAFFRIYLFSLLDIECPIKPDALSGRRDMFHSHVRDDSYGSIHLSGLLTFHLAFLSRPGQIQILTARFPLHGLTSS